VELSQKEMVLAHETAFEAAFRQHYGVLCNYACTYLRDRDEAEEIVQSVFLAFWEKRHSLEVHTSVKAYLFSMVRNASLNLITRKKMQEKYAQEKLLTAQSADNNQPVESDELAQRIAAALQKLPEQCRVIFTMSRFEELKYAEIAAELNLSVKTVENQIGKALKIMREQLRDYLPILFLLMLDILIR
jgi:RNA polymerase sigma-70 factor, ECF subfamily